MFETLDKMILAGVGALSITRQRAEKLFDEAVQQGRQSREGRQQFVDDLMDAAKKTRSDLESLVERQVRIIVDQMHLATKEDIARLEQKIDLLHTPTVPPQ